MRLLFILIVLAIGGFGLYRYADKHPLIKEKAESYLDFRTVNALEIRFESSQLMENNQKSLLKGKGRYLTSELKFFPYLLIEAKYAPKHNKTKETLMLWDLTDGEMVLDTKSWQKTHGFGDCMLNHIQSHEYLILRTLADKGGNMDSKQLQEKMGIESGHLEILIDHCVKKNLIIPANNNKYHLHVEKPKFTQTPETRLREPLTTRPQKKSQVAMPHFSRSQIERMVKIAFGEGFSIRNITEIYLPIHRILVQKSDGGIQTSHFNALTGKELPPSPFYK